MSAVPPNSPVKKPPHPLPPAYMYALYVTTLVITLVAEWYMSKYFYHELREQYKCLETANWQTTEGTVVKSEIVSPPLTSRKYEHALIEFEYSVNGHRHTSQSCNCGSEGFTGYKQISATQRVITVNAREAMARWPRGQRVVVAYNPNNHAEAYLEFTSNTFIGVVFIVIFAILLFFLVVVAAPFLIVVVGLIMICVLGVLHAVLIACTRRVLVSSSVKSNASDHSSG